MSKSNQLYQQELPAELVQACQYDWLFVLSHEDPYAAVFDYAYVLKLDEILDLPSEHRFATFSALVLEIELDGQESGRYGSGEGDQTQGIRSDELDI